MVSRMPDVNHIPFKICVLGDGRTGRSALAAALAPARTTHRGVRVTSWTDPVSGFDCEVWDQDGCCLLDSLGQPYLASADGFLVVVNARDPEGLAAVEVLLKAVEKLHGARPSRIVLNFAETEGSEPRDAPILGIPVVRLDARSEQNVRALVSELLEEVAASGLAD